MKRLSSASAPAHRGAMKAHTKALLLLIPLLCAAVLVVVVFQRRELTDMFYASISKPDTVQILPRARVEEQATKTALVSQPLTTTTTHGEAKPAATSHLPPAAAAVAVQPSDGASYLPPYQEVQRLHPDLIEGVAVVKGDDPIKHCQMTKGQWCGPYWTQTLQPSKPPPRSSKPCPADCKGLGWCDHDTGRCFCRAGYTGPDCSQPDKRHCASMGKDKRDSNITDGHWLHTRCSGICDDDIGMCHCPPETAFGRKIPLGQPADDPVLRGRPMFWCQPNSTADGTPVKWTWNIHKYEDVLGPEGWCNANTTMNRCSCALDGMVGSWCDTVVEQTCVNQCAGHGDCLLGFCRCHAGWYGHDCSRRKAGLPMEPGEHHVSKPWLKPVVRDVPAAADPQLRTHRRRPFIYVYDLHPMYNLHMMQYRLDRNIGVNRLFSDGNHSHWIGYNAYALETVFHELMLTSEHRTYDPDEADYFYVPVHVSNLADVVGKAHRPYWPVDEDGTARWGHRVYSMSVMLRDTQLWLQANYPFWNKSNGADHVWLLTHDEAPCYAPITIWDSVIISHWGRMDFPHGSNTSYGADNYTHNAAHPDWPNGWIEWSSGAHPCHDPEKHLVVPVFKQPPHYSHSQYLGAPLIERDILAFFRGDLGLTRHGCIYSRCIRQTIWKLYKANNWRAKYNVWFGQHDETPGEYTHLLSRSKFCLVIPGDGWSARYEDSALHGCVPVIIMDNTLGPFESQIEYFEFSIRVRENQLAQLVDILLAVSPEQLKQLQEGLANVWMRFRWNGLPLAERDVAKIVRDHKGRGHPLTDRPGLEWAQTADGDAFSTVMQWLYHRIPHTRKAAPRPPVPGASGPLRSPHSIVMQ
ncbi:exostosin-like glycosyltransferase [Haematococcus lacustris]